MLNPSDNRSLNCFVRESVLDNDFKLALYPRWHEVAWTMTNEICRAKELYFKTVSDPRIAQLSAHAPLELVKLHHDWSQVTDKWTSELKKISEEYAKELAQKLLHFAASLDASLRTAGKIERCFRPYVEEADKKRKSIFESFQRNLIDGLIWEHTSRENRKVEEGQPSVGNSTNHEVFAETPRPEQQSLRWDEYTEVNFASTAAVCEEPREDSDEKCDDLEDDVALSHQTSKDLPQLTEVKHQPLTPIQNGSCYITALEVKDAKLIGTVHSYGQRFEIDTIKKTAKPTAAHACQKCTTCNTDISLFYREIRRGSVVVAFVECRCGYYPLVAVGGNKTVRLPVQFDSSYYFNESRDHLYNRSAWSDDKRLVYCEKGTRTIVEYKWEDLEKGTTSHTRTTNADLKLGSASQTADLQLETRGCSVLLKDGSLSLRLGDRVSALPGSGS